jgi:hypothetical protein
MRTWHAMISATRFARVVCQVCRYTEPVHVPTTTAAAAQRRTRVSWFAGRPALSSWARPRGPSPSLSAGAPPPLSTRPAGATTCMAIGMQRARARGRCCSQQLRVSATCPCYVRLRPNYRYAVTYVAAGQRRRLCSDAYVCSNARSTSAGRGLQRASDPGGRRGAAAPAPWFAFAYFVRAHACGRQV